MKRIGILTSGGDAPGMNAAVRAAVRTATTRGIEVVGYRDGYTGLVEDHWEVLTDRAVGNIIQLGGTVIGTSRCPGFLDVGVRDLAAKRMLAQGVEGLVVVGGDGSFRGALALHAEHGIKVAGIPGTIDNDVWGTEHTIGFDTAVNTAMRAIDQVRDTSESTGMMFFVEVMGRTSGAIALSVSLAAGAAGVLIPEADEDIEEIVERVKVSMARGKRSHIIVVAEGEEAGGAFSVARYVAERFDHPYRVIVLGHIQRGGSPTALDRIVAAQSGAAAVEALSQGRSGIMIGIQSGHPVEVSLFDAVAKEHPPIRQDLLALARQIVG